MDFLWNVYLVCTRLSVGGLKITYIVDALTCVELVCQSHEIQKEKRHGNRKLLHQIKQIYQTE